MTGKLKINLDLGLLIKNAVIGEIKRVCFENDFKVEIEEHKNFLSSQYFITIEGSQSKLEPLKGSIEEYIHQISKE